MTEDTKFGVRIYYDTGRFDDIDLLKAPPSKVVVYRWDYADEIGTSILKLEEITDITPHAFYGLFLPREDNPSGVELHSPNGHRFFIEPRRVTNLMLVPLPEEPVA